MDILPGIGQLFSPQPVSNASSPSSTQTTQPQENSSRNQNSRRNNRRARVSRERQLARMSGGTLDLVAKYFLIAAIGFTAAWVTAYFFRSSIKRWFGLHVPTLPGVTGNCSSKKRRGFRRKMGSSDDNLRDVQKNVRQYLVHDKQVDSGFRPSGFTNLGNTCFMNSAMQALSAIPAFERYLRCLLVTNPGNANVNETLRLVSQVRPNVSSFHKTITYSLKNFGDYNQHDSQEFITCLLGLLDTVRRETVEHTNHSILVQEAMMQSGVATAPLAIQSIAKGLSVLHQRRNALEVDPFVGLEWQLRRCSKCLTTRSTKLVESRMITLHLPEQPTTLEACIAKYCSKETMHEVRCDYCTSICTLQEVLKQINMCLDYLQLPSLQERIDFITKARVQNTRMNLSSNPKISNVQQVESMFDDSTSHNAFLDSNSQSIAILRAIGVPITKNLDKEELDLLLQQYCPHLPLLSQKDCNEHGEEDHFIIFESEHQFGTPKSKISQRTSSSKSSHQLELYSTQERLEKLIAQARLLQTDILQMRSRVHDTDGAQSVQNIVGGLSQAKDAQQVLSVLSLLISASESVRQVSPSIYKQISNPPLIDGTIVTGTKGALVSDIVSKSTNYREISFARYPPILIFHLNRLMGEYKLQTRVRFSDVLNLEPQHNTFLHHITKQDTHSQKQPISKSKSSAIEPELQTENGLIYDLVGVVVHLGSAYGGHYIAYRRHYRQKGWEQLDRGREMSNNMYIGTNGYVSHVEDGDDEPLLNSPMPLIPKQHVWSYISDSDVREVPLSSVLESTPYMLFYQRR